MPMQAHWSSMSSMINAALCMALLSYMAFSLTGCTQTEKLTHTCVADKDEEINTALSFEFKPYACQSQCGYKSNLIVSNTLHVPVVVFLVVVTWQFLIGFVVYILIERLSFQTFLETSRQSPTVGPPGPIGTPKGSPGGPWDSDRIPWELLGTPSDA